MSDQTVTLTLREDEIQRLYNTWKEAEHPCSSPYIRFQLRPENAVITCYTSGKAVFQGKDADVYASPFIRVSEPAETSDFTSRFPQAGSDEVGTGDYFGPVCVCACKTEAQDIGFLQAAGVQDSKQITDETIRKIAPLLQERLIHSLLIVPPVKYNSIHHTYNMNAVKSLLHNQAYVNLAKKTKLPELLIIDQFTPERAYYKWLKQEQTVIRPIHFETKAENKFLSVAAASIIARNAFLQAMDEYESFYGMKLLKGAGTRVDDCAREFIRKYGKDRLKEVAKLHFKNTERL